jgi:DNA adenine methylase
MRYFGGKFRVRKQIAEFLNSYNPKYYLEPFCGSAWVAELIISDTRVCCDMNADLIALFMAVQSGWEPPDFISEQEYASAKMLTSPNPLRAFCGFGCSFAGKFFGGYARGGHGADAKTAKSQLIKRMYAKTAKSQGLTNVEFCHCDFELALELFDSADLIYCDPPYIGTTKFYGTPDFDTNHFWSVIRSQAQNGKNIFVSEYTCPDDFVSCLEIPTRTDIRSATGILLPRVEKLFTYKKREE